MHLNLLGVLAILVPAIDAWKLAAINRRSLCRVLAPIVFLPFDPPAHAFPNAVKAALDEPPRKSPGPRPTDIGLKRAGGLRPCMDGKPHCFSSTLSVGDFNADTSKIGTDWLVTPWTFSGSVAGAMGELKKAIDMYPPGQGGIDEGGFQIVSTKLPEQADDAGYLYVQFQSRTGYIDDVEFAAYNGVVNVRTSSRLGFLDYGVNAKRYNWFATRLGTAKGWKTAAIKSKDHRNYFVQNDLDSDKDVGL